MGALRYTPEEISAATRYYVKPDCQNIDPAGAEDFRHQVTAREPLFGAIDRIATNPGKYKFVIFLADSGMGKTSFFLNYYAEHQRRWWKPRRYDVALVPLNRPEGDQWIGEIENPENTVLCLDALDEDRKAIEDHRGRILELVKLTKGFRAVVITCRSQFFPTDEEIPVETGLLKIAVRAAGEEAEYLFRKFYLSPFTDDQVESYLRRRFSWYQHRERRRAREIAAKIGDLVARPMLLAHIEDLVGSDLDYEYAFQIYEEMVNSWLQREKGYVKDTEALREFSELVAVNLLLNQKQRGWERIPGSELQPLAEAYQIPLQGWQLRGRSLLNKDADGNCKFAHRSVT